MDKTMQEMMAILDANSEGEVSALGKIRKGNQKFQSLVSDAEQKADAKAKERKEAEEKRKAELSKDHIFISTITGGRLPESGIDHEIYVFPEDTWDEDHKANIPEVDKHYYWDADLLEMMILCIKLQERGLLTGMPGTGKTSATKQLAAWRKQPFARFNGKEGIEPASLLGYAWADSEIIKLADGTEKVVPVMKFKEGLMPVAVRNGYLTVIDEVMKLSPGIQMALQSLYEKGGFLMVDDNPGSINDKQVKPDEKFLLFCTDNTCGTGDKMDLFAASQLQDTSTLDRFGLTFEVKYLPTAVEKDVLKGMHPEIEDRDVKDLVSLATLVRNSYKDGSLPVTLSPRGLMSMCGVLSNGLSWEHTVKIVFGNKLGEDGHVSQLSEHLRTVRR